MGVPAVPTAGMFQPAGDVLVFVSGVVVDHQMNVQIGGNLPVDQFQKTPGTPGDDAGVGNSVMIFPVAVSNAANKVIVPLRL